MKILNDIVAYLLKNIATVILIAFVIFYLWDRQKYKEEKTRLLANQTILANGISSLQKTFKPVEFKEIYGELKSMLAEYGIKIKQVDHYIQTSYNFVDSPIVSHYTRVDSFPDTRFFTIYDNCYEISGISYKDSIISQALRHDTLSTFLYRQTNKDIFPLFRWWHKLWDGVFYYDAWKYKAITISSCNNDTLSVNDNVKVHR
jgi:hypothetical protein